MGGWAYVKKNDIKGHKPTVSYGCCKAIDPVDEVVSISFEFQGTGPLMYN